MTQDAESRATDLVHGGYGTAVVLDEDLVVRSASDGIPGLLGYDRDQLVGRRVTALLDADDREAFERSIAAVGAGAELQPELYRLQHEDGSWRWVELWLSDLRHEPAIAGLVARLRDLTEQHHADQALRASEQLYRLIVENADQGICLFDFAGFITLANARLSQMLGYDADELIGMQILDLVHPTDRGRGMAFRRKRLAGLSQRGELRLQRREGPPLHVLLGLSPLEGPDGEPLGALAMVTDISEQKAAEHRLARSAATDPLTRLANRTLLFERLDAALAAAARQGTQVAVVYFDVDHFKLVNDSIGHAAGDALLLTLAGRLSASLRSADTTIARLGGDEFVVLCESVLAAEEVEAITGRIRAISGEPMTIAGRELRVSLSIGVAFGPPGDAQTLLADADHAMYEAKRRGRARTVVFDERLGKSDSRDDLLGELGKAVTDGQLVLHHQPIVTLADHHVVAVEALSRWQHPGRGLLQPSVFLRAAEDSGVIVDLDRRVLRETVALAADQARTGSQIPVALNLSARTLASADFVEDVRVAVADAGLDPSLLILEVTERAVLPDAQHQHGLLERLGGLGVRLALDGFATGHSSLTVLSRLPVDAVKIDRSVVAQVPGPADRTVAAVVGAARALGIVVTAVGVESTATRDRLYDLGCQAAQGHVWSPPVPASRLPSLVADAGVR